MNLIKLFRNCTNIASELERRLGGLTLTLLELK